MQKSQLDEALTSAWQSLEPETEKILGNIEMLPHVCNSEALPYRNYALEEEFFVQNVFQNITHRPKSSGKDKVKCLICDTELALNKMRNHVGSHILHSLRDIPDPNSPLVSVGAEPCGFCGMDGCLTQFKSKNTGGGSITSSCQYHYVGMVYKAAASWSKGMPCTNVPINCPLCPISVSGDHQTIWKYNALYHLASEHSNENNSPPSIPGELLVQIFISKAEEKGLGITNIATDTWREQYNIPNSDGIEQVKENLLKRGRSDSTSIVSMLNDPKKSRLDDIHE